jgi:hypothetical protein
MLQTLATGLISDLGSSYRLVRPSKNGEQVLASIVHATFDTQVSTTFTTTNGGIITNDTNMMYLAVVKNGKVEPQTEDRLIQGNKGWRIISVEAVRPDNKLTIMYMLKVS